MQFMPIKFGKLNDMNFFVEKDGKYVNVGYLNECWIDEESEQTAKSQKYDAKMAYLGDKEFSFYFTLDQKSEENLIKYGFYGGDRGRYNGYVLHRDGYLSTKNAWIKGQ